MQRLKQLQSFTPQFVHATSSELYLASQASKDPQLTSNGALPISSLNNLTPLRGEQQTNLSSQIGAPQQQQMNRNDSRSSLLQQMLNKNLNETLKKQRLLSQIQSVAGELANNNGAISANRMRNCSQISLDLGATSGAGATPRGTGTPTVNVWQAQPTIPSRLTPSNSSTLLTNKILLQQHQQRQGATGIIGTGLQNIVRKSSSN